MTTRPAGQQATAAGQSSETENTVLLVIEYTPQLRLRAPDRRSALQYCAATDLDVWAFTETTVYARPKTEDQSK